MTPFALPRFVLTSHVEEHTGRPATVVYGDIFEQVALADAAGFDALWLAEHHFGAQEGLVSQPVLVALAAALRNSRIKAGTSLIVLPLHHPLAVAEQLATLSVLLGDRLSIGFGSGSAPFEFAGFGVSFDGPVRHARFREALAIIERAWTGEPFSHESEHFPIGEVRLVPRPTLPLRDVAWIGAMSEATAAVAGEFGYGLQLPRGIAAADYGGVLGAYRSALRATWGPDARERVAIARCIYVGEDDASAIAEVGPTIQRFWGQSKRAVKGEPLPSVPDLIDRLHFIVGGPERCAREIAALQQATGLSHLSVQPTWIGMTPEMSLNSLRRFGEGVIPRLRELATAGQLAAD